jgi:hypothetical protein
VSIDLRLLRLEGGDEASSVCSAGPTRSAVTIDSSIDLVSFRTVSDCSDTRLSGFVDDASPGIIREESFSVGFRLVDGIDSTLSDCSDTTLSVLIDSSSGRE